MHELSIALSILDMAEEEAERHGGAGGRRPSAARPSLRRGQGSASVGLRAGARGSPRGTAELVVEEVPARRISARRCDAERTMRPFRSCAAPCAARRRREVVSGRELEVVALEIEDMTPQPDWSKSGSRC